MLEINTVLSDIKVFKNIMTLDIDVYDGNTFLTNYIVKLNYKEMNLNSQMDYEFQLSKDIDRIVRNYYFKHRELPNAEKVKKSLQNIRNNFIIRTQTRNDR